MKLLLEKLDNMITFKESEDLLLENGFKLIALNRRISKYEDKKRIAFIVYSGLGNGYYTYIYMKDYIDKLHSKLEKVEKKLDKCRTTVMLDGWQTQKHAKKLAKWDYYAEIKRELLVQIYEAETTELLNTKTQEELIRIKKNG